MQNTTGQAELTLSERQRRIFEFLDANTTGVLASVDPDSAPHASVIYYIANKADLSVSFLTKVGTKKYANLTRDNHVVLVVFNPETRTTAQVAGRAQNITDPYKINAVAADVFKKCLELTGSDVLPISELEAGDYTAFKIVPDQIRLARYPSEGAEKAKPCLESIESFELDPTA